MKKAMGNEKASAAFVGAIGEIKERLEVLNEYMDNRMDTSPEEINWGHVGSANHIRELLDGIIGFANIKH